MRTLYLADTFPTDFENPEGAKKKINDYVEKQTKGKIVDLIKSLDGTQVMVMVNYIFFKGKTLGLESELPLCRCFWSKTNKQNKRTPVPLKQNKRWNRTSSHTHKRVGVGLVLSGPW